MIKHKDFLSKLKKELDLQGLMSEADFFKCLREAEETQHSLVEALYHSAPGKEKDLLGVLCKIFDYEPVGRQIFEIEPEILKWIPREVAGKREVLPIRHHEHTLTVAITDPTNIGVLDEIHILSGLRVHPVLVTPSELRQAISQYYGGRSEIADTEAEESFSKIMEDIRSQILSKRSKSGTGDLSDLLEAANATPIVRLVNHILIEGIRRKASDIFIEPWENSLRVRYRVDGLLEEVLKTPGGVSAPVISRIKVMSRLNIAEHRLPQDGRFKARIFGPEVDLRVSILPTCFGEKACLRILSSSTQVASLDSLGFSAEELEVIRRTALRPHGMILVTGPTGSGKTTTLYAVLKYLDSPEKNITTVEDPVEYQVPGINQVNVRDQVGLTFPVALRSILRQDPNIILIGEIRDQVTMDIAIKAALTGHLVLSTLHTNDATSAIVRMANMGIEPFLIASSVLVISAQRLVRKLCPICRTAYAPEPQLLQSLNLPADREWEFFRAKGCEQCRSTGFKGRTVISELFELKPPIIDRITGKASGEEIRNLARELGMVTLRESGVEKVKTGVTSAEEVIRVTSPESSLHLVKARR